MLIYGINCRSGIGDTKFDVLGFGSVTISSDVNQKVTLKTLPEVLYVPGLGVNLFSIGAATASGLTAEFKDDKVFFISQFINKTSIDLNLIEHYQGSIHQRWGISSHWRTKREHPIPT
jgi:hypothetical protein